MVFGTRRKYSYIEHGAKHKRREIFTDAILSSSTEEPCVQVFTPSTGYKSGYRHYFCRGIPTRSFITVLFLYSYLYSSFAVTSSARLFSIMLSFVVFFTLTDRASTILSTTWLPIRYVVCWTERDQRNIYQAPMRAKEKHKQTKTTKRKEQE